MKVDLPSIVFTTKRQIPLYETSSSSLLSLVQSLEGARVSAPQRVTVKSNETNRYNLFGKRCQSSIVHEGNTSTLSESDRRQVLSAGQAKDPGGVRPDFDGAAAARGGQSRMLIAGLRDAASGIHQARGGRGWWWWKRTKHDRKLAGESWRCGHR